MEKRVLVTFDTLDALSKLILDIKHGLTHKNPAQTLRLEKASRRLIEHIPSTDEGWYEICKLESEINKCQRSVGIAKFMKFRDAITNLGKRYGVESNISNHYTTKYEDRFFNILRDLYARGFNRPNSNPRPAIKAEVEKLMVEARKDHFFLHNSVGLKEALRLQLGSLYEAGIENDQNSLYRILLLEVNKGMLEIAFQIHNLTGEVTKELLVKLARLYNLPKSLEKLAKDSRTSISYPQDTKVIFKADEPKNWFVNCQWRLYQDNIHEFDAIINRSIRNKAIIDTIED